jgi:glycosyltransferase involved in cell wall biosynthesis
MGAVSDVQRSVSVGLPTRNGERFLRQALDSLLAQTYPASEILISDNASTDRTPAIAQEYAASHPSVRYLRQERDFGAAANFNAVFRATTGDLFMWAADDDVWAPRYIEECVAALEAHPEAVLACTRLQFIDPSGDPIAMDYTGYDNPDVSAPSVHTRLEILVRRNGWYQLYGLIRRKALARTRLAQDRYGMDVVLLAELAILGPFALVPAVRFSYRQYPDRTEAVRAATIGRGAAYSSATPYTHLAEGLSDAVRASHLPARTKLMLRARIQHLIYLSRTAIGAKARGEAPIRARLAAAQRDWGSFVKYALLALLVAPGRNAKELLRT